MHTVICGSSVTPKLLHFCLYRNLRGKRKYLLKFEHAQANFTKHLEDFQNPSSKRLYSCERANLEILHFISN